MAEKYGDAAMYGANSRLGNKQAAAGYYRAADRADAREQTAGQPVLNLFTAAPPGTFKDLAAAGENAGGQPEAGKKVLDSIVPNTAHAFHDDPVQTTLNATVVLDGVGGVLGSAGKLAGAGRVGRGARVLGGKSGSAAFQKLPLERQVAAQRAMRAVTTRQERRQGGAVAVRRAGEPHTEESLAKANAEQAQMHKRWEQGRHTGHHRGQGQALAHAGEAPASKHTAAIGSRGGVLKMTGAGRRGKVTAKASDAQIKKVIEETKKQADEAIATSKANRTAKKPQPAPGPCQGGILDLKTGKFYANRNTIFPPEKVHPILKKRLDDYKARTGGLALDRAGVLEDDYAKGMHAEVGVLNGAFLDREAMNMPVTEEDMDEFLLHNIYLTGKTPGELPQPRCFNCFHITQGVQVTPELGASEFDFYNEEYGPDFIDNVARLYPDVWQGNIPKK